LLSEPAPDGGYDVLAEGQVIFYGRLNQKGADNTESLEIDNKALGVLANIDYGRPGGWENNLSLLAAYTWDEKVDSDIETARLVWAPLPAWSAASDAANWWLRSFRNYAPFKIGNKTFLWRNSLTGEAVYGHAVEPGSDPLFQADKSYFQAGGVAATGISWVNMNLLRLGPLGRCLAGDDAVRAVQMARRHRRRARRFRAVRRRPDRRFRREQEIRLDHEICPRPAR
jgi:hypothetical protein